MHTHNLPLPSVPFLPLILLLAVLLLGCSAPHPSTDATQINITKPAQAQAPLPRESPEAFLAALKPALQGLASWRELETPLANSMQYAAAKPAGALAIKRPGLAVTWGRVTAGLALLRSLLPELDTNPGLLARHFEWVRADEGIMYTGYYEPVIHARRTRAPGFTQAIYSVPPDLARTKKHKRKYHDRAAIDKKGVLRGKGLEMAWLDPVEAFFLQIQGSGRLRFEDQSESYVNYAAQNGHNYTAIGRIMREQGLLEENNVNMSAVKNWLRNNPARQEEMLLNNPSYVFFRWGERPKGAMGFPGHPWVSLAVSRPFIPLGAIIAYGVYLPDPDAAEGTGRLLRGLGLAQDTGGAIKGGRIDIFCGDTPFGAHVAGHLDAQGEAWILLPKN